jgi:predicted outer membrane protein
MKAKPVLKAAFFKALFLLIMILATSCRKSNSIENALKKNETFTKNEKEKEEVEAFFFIATANVGKTIISKSQIAQQKSSENSIVILGNKIEKHQTRLLQEVTELANKKLLIISEINATHRRDTYDLVTAKNSSDFNKVYLNAMKKCLEEQIDLLETVSKETNDKAILKLVLKYLPEQYDLLREVEQKIKERN